MKITKKQLYLYVKINFLILALFVVIVLMYSLRNKGLPESATESLQLKNQRTAIIQNK